VEGLRQFASDGTSRWQRVLWVALRALARVLFVALFRVRVFGQDNVPPEGGVLILSNHQSYLDPVLLGLGLERPVSYMARRSLFRNRAFAWLISALNAFPVTRGGRDVRAMREAVGRLREGWCLVVFPEGTRTSDGRIGRLHAGVLSIAERAGVPVVPAVVEGAFGAWPRNGPPRPHPIDVAYGRPILAGERGGRSREELAGRIREEMLRLQEALRDRQARAEGRVLASRGSSERVSGTAAARPSCGRAPGRSPGDRIRQEERNG